MVLLLLLTTVFLGPKGIDLVGQEGSTPPPTPASVPSTTNSPPPLPSPSNQIWPASLPPALPLREITMGPSKEPSDEVRTLNILMERESCPLNLWNVSFSWFLWTQTDSHSLYFLCLILSKPGLSPSKNPTVKPSAITSGNPAFGSVKVWIFITA